MKEKIKTTADCFWYGIFLLAYGVIIGLIVGVIDAGFGRVLLGITAFRGEHIVWLLPFLAPVGVLIVWAYEKYGGSSKQGMGLIFKVGHGEEEKIPLRLIPFSIVGTWLTHLFGGSAGREGVAVQIGATFSQWFGKKIRKNENTNVFLIAGMAAGFAGLFGTPIAAVFFALEVLVVGAFQYQALIPAISSAFVASMTSRALGLEKFEYALAVSIPLNAKVFCMLVILGALFGSVGAIFALLLKYLKEKFGQMIENPMKRIFLFGLFLSILLLLCWHGRYSGLGTNLISLTFGEGTVYPYDWVLKLLFTVFTLSIGFQGGEVTPLFSIGASLGAIVAPFFGIPVVFGGALGYIAVFGSATNTFLAPMLIGAEVFGYQYLPYFFIVCAIAYVVSGNYTIYGGQKQRD